jgi:hypothetical protein
MQLLKLSYEKYLERLKDYFQNMDTNTKTHYENYISKLKQKAVKRIEFEQEERKKREAELQKELAAKDEQMEDLRDINATRECIYMSHIIITLIFIHCMNMLYSSTGGYFRVPGSCAHPQAEDASRRGRAQAKRPSAQRVPCCFD